MLRITGADVASNLHGTGKHGFRERVPGVSGPTIVTSAFCNDVQEELANATEGYGFLLGSSNHQLSNALRLSAVESAILNQTARAPISFGTGFSACAFGAGLLVAIGSESGVGPIIQTSPDGVTWTSRTPASGAGTSTIGLTFESSVGSGLFVAVGSPGLIHTSANGTSWTARTPAGGYTGVFRGVAFGAGLFVAVGSAGEIQTSPDGTTWTKRTQAASYAGAFTNVTFGNGLFVAVGSGGEIQTSPNGTTWTHQSTGSGYNNTLWGAAYGAGVYVAVGAAGEIQSSVNGTAWTRRSVQGAFTGTYLTVSGRDLADAYGGNLLLVAGTDGQLLASVDGLDWRRLTRTLRFTGMITGIRYHPPSSTYVLVGEHTNTLSGPVVRQTQVT